MDGVLVGDEYVSGRSVVSEPMSLEAKNRVALVDLQELLVAVVRPELRSARGASARHRGRAVLLEALATLPSERGARVKADTQHKPLRTGVARVVAGDDLANANGRVDDVYDYATVAMPLLADIGERVARERLSGPSSSSQRLRAVGPARSRCAPVDLRQPADQHHGDRDQGLPCACRALCIPNTTS
jgi:hypothetical protein